MTHYYHFYFQVMQWLLYVTNHEKQFYFLFHVGITTVAKDLIEKYACKSGIKHIYLQFIYIVLDYLGNKVQNMS